MELISVIVPVYNVSDYLEHCLNTITRQTYSNLEIILIDDGSTDNSGNICDMWKKKDNRIQVYHTHNEGLSSARNNGFVHSTGEFVCFVDSDDYIAPDYIEALYNNLINTNSDISMCGYARITQNDYFENFSPSASHLWTFSSDELLSCWHGRYSAYETVAWNKLYRKEVLESFAPLLFPVGMLHEDIYTSHIFVSAAQRIVITDSALYAYRQRTGSITHSAFNYHKILHQRKAQLSRYEFFQKHEKDISCLNLITGMLKHDIFYYFKCFNKEISGYKTLIAGNLNDDFCTLKRLPGYSPIKPVHLSFYLAHKLICRRRFK